MVVRHALLCRSALCWGPAESRKAFCFLCVLSRLFLAPRPDSGDGVGVGVAAACPEAPAPVIARMPFRAFRDYPDSES